MSTGRRLILDGVDIEMSPGECVAVMGPSGSGKTTLLNCIAGLRPIDDGEIEVGGRRLSLLHERGRARVRLQRVGTVFQFGELLPELTLAENVGLPLRLRGARDDARVTELLDSLSLSERSHAHPPELSGGEIQRAAIARALIGSPAVILADEPTGALDEDLSQVVCELLTGSTRRIGAALLVVTHDPLVGDAMDRTMRLRHGKLEPV